MFRAGARELWNVRTASGRLLNGTALNSTALIQDRYDDIPPPPALPPNAESLRRPPQDFSQESPRRGITRCRFYLELPSSKQRFLLNNYMKCCTGEVIEAQDGNLYRLKRFNVFNPMLVDVVQDVKDIFALMAEEAAKPKDFLICVRKELRQSAHPTYVVCQDDESLRCCVNDFLKLISVSSLRKDFDFRLKLKTRNGTGIKDQRSAERIESELSEARRNRIEGRTLLATLNSYKRISDSHDGPRIDMSNSKKLDLLKRDRAANQPTKQLANGYNIPAAYEVCFWRKDDGKKTTLFVKPDDSLSDVELDLEEDFNEFCLDYCKDGQLLPPNRKFFRMFGFKSQDLLIEVSNGTTLRPTVKPNATPTLKRKITEIVISDSEEEESPPKRSRPRDWVCSICHDNDEPVIVTSWCGHEFHGICILGLFRTRPDYIWEQDGVEEKISANIGDERNCPLCREELNPEKMLEKSGSADLLALLSKVSNLKGAIYQDLEFQVRGIPKNELIETLLSVKKLSEIESIVMAAQ